MPTACYAYGDGATTAPWQYHESTLRCNVHLLVGGCRVKRMRDRKRRFCSVSYPVLLGYAWRGDPPSIRVKGSHVQFETEPGKNGAVADVYVMEGA